MGVEFQPSHGSRTFAGAVMDQVDRPWFLTILAATALCAAYLLAALLNWGDVAERSLYSNLGLLPAGMAATLLTWCAAQNHEGRRSRTAWRLLSLGFGCFFAGDFLFFVYQNVLGRSPFPSVADAGYLAYYPLVFAALVCLPSGDGRRPRRGSFSLKVGAALLAACALVVLVVFVYLVPTLGSSRRDLLAYSLSVGYPVGDLLLLAGLAVLLVRRGAQRIPGSLMLLAFGLLVGLGADVLYGYQGIQGALQAGGLSDAGYMVSWILFAWAGYLEFARTDRERSQAEDAE